MNQLEMRRLSSLARTWGPLIFILALGLALRVAYWPDIGQGDLWVHGLYVGTIQQVGALNFYRQYQDLRLYPPIMVAIFDLIGRLYVHTRLLQLPFSSPLWNYALGSAFKAPQDPWLVMLLKVPAIAADVALIVIAYVWLRKRRWARWLVPGAMAVSPGIVMNSMWWGQYDNLLMVFIVLAILALEQDHILLSWSCFGLALLTKQQAIVLAPLLIVLTFRHCGLRRLIQGGIACAMVVVLGFAPFVLADGLKTGLRPYLDVDDRMEFVTNGALNLWYLYAIPANGAVTNIDWMHEPNLADDKPMIAGLTYRTFGYLMMGLYTLIIAVAMWRDRAEKRGFVWATVLYLASFMLLTQAHERYIYNAAILALFAIAQDPRSWPLALGIQFTTAYNLAQVAAPLPWFGRQFVWLTGWQAEIAMFNTILLAEVTRLALTIRTAAGRAWRVMVLLERAACVLVILAMLVVGVPELFTTFRTARWFSDNAAAGVSVMLEDNAREVKSMTGTLGSASLQWNEVRRLEDTSVSQMTMQGVNYFVLDDRTHPADTFKQAIKLAQREGAMVLWRTGLTPGLTPRQVILSTAHTEQPIDDTFNDSITLVGYSILTDRSDSVGMLLHWQVQHSPSTAYHEFLHLLDPANDQLIAQKDRELGHAPITPLTWKPGEQWLEAEYVKLPGRKDGTCPLLVGLYDLNSGRRAQVMDQSGKALGDGVEFKVSCGGSKS